LAIVPLPEHYTLISKNDGEYEQSSTFWLVQLFFEQADNKNGRICKGHVSEGF